MLRRFAALLGTCALLACARSTDRLSTENTPRAAAPEAFVGAWRSITPQLEFVGLSVYSKSSQQGVFGVRLTYSGVAFDGNGRLDADSLVVSLTVSGTAQPAGVLIARAPAAGALHVERRDLPTACAGASLDFVRAP
jgi:hypothetical protein